MKLNIFQGELSAANYPENFFDAITMIELIEHLSDPLSTLKETFRILKPGGVLVIQTANAGSFKAKLTRNNWEYFQPGHLFYFTPQTLTKMLEKNGFRITRFYAGDELGIKTKWRSCLKKYEKQNWATRWQECLKIPVKHVLRRISLGKFTFGGMVIYATKNKITSRC